MTDNLPRVMYSNIGVDFSPLHDKRDRDLPAFKEALGRFHPNRIGKAEEGRRYEVTNPIDDRVTVGSFVEASADAVDRVVVAVMEA
jgi:1-pyrroline-5-carboxylate dehydrogenase